MGAPACDPEGEPPANKAEADAMALFGSLNQPALDYYAANRRQIESELTMFVAKNGELPPAVEEGRIFAWERTGLERERIKKEGLKLYMRKGISEA